MKIKTKKQLNLPQLIEWAWNNNVRNRHIRADQDISAVFINKFGDVYTTDDVKHDYTFTIEVEEEITEDTKLDLIERFIGGTDSVCYTSQRATIKECLKRTPRDCTTTHFYIENDDRELVLIWQDGKLI